MTTKRSFPVVCLAAAAFATICLHAENLSAQSPLAPKRDQSLMPGPVPVEPPASDLPVPTATPEPAAVRRPTATFTFGDGNKITARMTTSRFRLVGLHPGEIVDVALQFPAGLPGNSALAQPLDGGKLISFSKSNIGIGGLASIRFQAGAQPGLYRVFVPGLGATALLQFWVADPNNPKANPPVLNPGH